MNRLDKYLDEDKGGRPMEADFNIQDLQEKLKSSSGYMLAVTFLNKGKLDSYFITNNFPTGDIGKSVTEWSKLANATLEASENPDESKK